MARIPRSRETGRWGNSQGCVFFLNRTINSEDCLRPYPVPPLQIRAKTQRRRDLPRTCWVFCCCSLVKCGVGRGCFSSAVGGAVGGKRAFRGAVAQYAPVSGGRAQVGSKLGLVWPVLSHKGEDSSFPCEMLVLHLCCFSPLMSPQVSEV